MRLAHKRQVLALLLSGIIATAVIVIVVLCNGRHNPKDSIQVAVSEIENQLLNMGTHPNGTESQCHAIRSLGMAAAMLNGKTAAEIHMPIPIVADWKE